MATLTPQTTEMRGQKGVIYKLRAYESLSDLNYGECFFRARSGPRREGTGREEGGKSAVLPQFLFKPDRLAQTRPSK